MSIRVLLAAFVAWMRELITVGMVISFVIGLFFGWIVMGWGIWPVSWTDASPADLHQGYKDIYLEQVARNLAQDPQMDLNRALGPNWGEKKLEKDLGHAYRDATEPAKSYLTNLAARLNLTLPDEVTEGKKASLLPICAVGLLVFVGVGGAYVLWQKQRAKVEPTRPMIGGRPEKVAAGLTVYEGEEAPLAQFVTSYSIGEDYYDQSYSIETGTGEFLGECGVGISEAIGIGDPKKVTAFEVWLFDKNDIRTVTKVLMSEHAFADEGIRTKLAPKGEAVLGQEGEVITLETASLRIMAKIIEMEYGQGELPPNSFVTRLTMELSAWQLEGEIASPAPSDLDLDLDTF